MKKLLALSITALLVLAGCSTASPEAAFEKASDKVEETAQTISFVVASVLTTEDGDIAFDNMGTIHQEAGDNFKGIVEAKVEMDRVYEDVVVYAPGDKFVMELQGQQTTTSLEEILNKLGLIDFTELDELVDEYDSATTEGSVHTYTFNTSDLEEVLEFSTHGHLQDLKFKNGSMKQTIIVDKDVLTENQIYIEATYTDFAGVEYPVTQKITLKYTEGSTVEYPDFN